MDRSNREDQIVPVEPPALALTREDLAALVASYRRAVRDRRQWAMLVAGIGGLALGAALITLGERLGWPESLSPVFFFGGWTVMLASAGLAWRRERRLRLQHQFHCPACDAQLVDRLASREPAPVDLAIVTGRCPRCGAQILPP